MLKKSKDILARLLNIALIVVVLASALVFLVPFLTNPNLMDGNAPFLDDFYYYFVIAGRIVSEGRFTFDGVNLTNGFHPAWQIIMAAIRWLFGSNISVQYFAILASCYSLLLITAIQSARLSKAIIPTDALNYLCNAMLLMALCLGAFRSGLEINLVTVFGLVTLIALLQAVQRDSELSSEAFTCGALVALSALARVESILLFFPLLLYVAYAKRLPNSRNRLVWLLKAGMGLVPFIGYLIANYFVFEGALPQSSAAKARIWESENLWVNAIDVQLAFKANFAISRLNWIAIARILTAAALILLIFNWRAVETRTRWFLVGVFTFPWCYLALASVSSSYSVEGWYNYPFLLASAFFLPTLGLTSLPARRHWVVIPVVAFSVSIVGVILMKSINRSKTGRVDINTAVGRAINEFVQHHPGYYAMGDMAGFTALATGVSILQLEGLVGGQDVLESAKRGADLKEYLIKHGVDYYISSREVPGQKQECPFFSEPSIQKSKRKLAHVLVSSFCDPPVWTRDIKGFPYPIRIYRLSKGG